MNRRIAFVAEGKKVRIYFGTGDEFNHNYWNDRTYVREKGEALELIERIWKTDEYIFRPFWGIDLGLVFERRKNEDKNSNKN